MKNILKIFVLMLLLLLGTNITNAIKTIQIKQNNLTLIDYKNSPKKEKAVKEWKIKFFLSENKNIELINDSLNKKIYFKINGENISEKGFLNIKYKNNLAQIPYEVNYKKKIKIIPKIKKQTKKSVKNGLNIAGKMPYKRLQKRALSCEAAAAADIISYFKWKNINEYRVYDMMNKSMPYPVHEGIGKNFWWNPDEGFVGHVWKFGEKNIKPSQRKMTWYWVYEKPVAKVFNKFWLKTEIINNSYYYEFFREKKHLELLLKSLEKWHMIQLWWDRCTDSKYEDWVISKNVSQKNVNAHKNGKNYCSTLNQNREMIWYYTKKKWGLQVHKWLIWEHAFYLLWYEWTIKNPSKIIVWDTNTGYHKYKTIEWMRKWKKMDYRSIIIYNPKNNKEIVY